MESRTYHMIFDLDSVVCAPIGTFEDQEFERAYKYVDKEFLDAHKFVAYGYTHLIYPGFYALWQWLVQEGMTLTIFSSGIKERNEELVEKLLNYIFRDWKEADKPEVKIYSRKDCINTGIMMEEEEKRKYQSFWFGNLKKQLKGVVVSQEELPNTLLIEDDPSYVAFNEEENLVWVDSIIGYAPYSQLSRNVHAFHKAYYIAGLIEEIREEAQKNQTSLIKAARYVQREKYNPEGEGKESMIFPSRNVDKIYERGLKILQQFDPSLKFYMEIKERED